MNKALLERQTTYTERLGDAIETLCRGNRPSNEIVVNWIEDDSNLELQEFCINNGPSWAQGIAVIDAAEVLAAQPREGEGHELKPKRELAIAQQDAAPVAPEVHIGWLHTIAAKSRPHDPRIVFDKSETPALDDAVLIKSEKAYTSLPIVALSDEEIIDINNDHSAFGFDQIAFARAIEAALLAKVGAK